MPRAAGKTTVAAIESACAERERLRAEIEPTVRRIRTLSRFIASGGAVLGRDMRGPTLAQRMVAFLRERGKPMAPRELLDALEATGVVVGGKGRHGRLLVVQITLTRSALIERVDYGRYGLAEWSASTGRMRRTG